MRSEPIAIRRDCVAIKIPDGTPLHLHAGTEVCRMGGLEKGRVYHEFGGEINIVADSAAENDLQLVSVRNFFPVFA